MLCKRKLAKVAVSVYSPAYSHYCRNKYLTPNYCGNVLESKGIGTRSFPIGYKGFVKTSKIQGNSLLLSNANNFVVYLYIYIYIFKFNIKLFFLLIHHIIFHNL